MSEVTPGTPRRGGIAALAPWLALALALIALTVVLLHFWQAQQNLSALRMELADRLAKSDQAASDARTLANAAQQNTHDALNKIATLEGKLAESQSQQIALEALYQQLMRDRDAWSLTEIEQAIGIAAQQLQLGSNVTAALVALEAADQRLARMDDPRLVTLRKAVQGDIERLKAVRSVDTQGTNVRIERLIEAVAKLPLAYQARPAPSSSQSQSNAGKGGFWQEVKDLIRVERLDRPPPPLLTPEQSYFARENLKLRLQGARVALLRRDAGAYAAELKTARNWLIEYFDVGNAPGQSALAGIDRLLASPVSASLPELNASLGALHEFYAAREKVTP